MTDFSRDEYLESLQMDKQEFRQQILSWLQSCHAYVEATEELPFLVLNGSDTTETVNRICQMAQFYLAEWADKMLEKGCVSGSDRIDIERAINKKWGE